MRQQNVPEPIRSRPPVANDQGQIVSIGFSAMGRCRNLPGRDNTRRGRIINGIAVIISEDRVEIEEHVEEANAYQAQQSPRAAC